MGKKTAAILSLLIIGLGQFYAGHFWRAVAWFFGSILIVGILSMLTGIGGIISAPIIWIGCAWDAYNLVR
jgi:TM2 domain-containing membrane protein YozV